MSAPDRYPMKHDYVYNVRNKDAERKEIESLLAEWTAKSNIPQVLPSPGDCFSEVEKLSEFRK